MQTSLMPAFNEIAAEAYEAFPNKLRNLAFFFTASSDAPVYVSPEIAGKLTKDTAVIKAAVEEMAKKMSDEHWAGFANRDYKLAGTAISLIAVDNKTGRGNISNRYKQQMRLIFTLDHEIGHHILRNGYPSSIVSGQKAESAADAYAMLRHIQRFGKNADYAGNLAENRVSHIVLQGDPDHYTTDALQRAIQRAEELGDKLFGLSLQETAALAEQIADACCIDDAKLSRVNKAFWPVHALYNKNADSGMLYREIVSVMRTHQHDPDVVKAGRLYLGQPAPKEFIAAAARSDCTWQEARDFTDNDQLRIVDEAGVNAATLSKINDAFKPVQAFYSQRNSLSEKAYNIMLCRTAVSVMREHQDDADIFNAGNRFLSDPKRAGFIGDAIQSGDPFWNDAFYFMKTHRPKPAKPAKRGLLRRLHLRR